MNRIRMTVHLLGVALFIGLPADTALALALAKRVRELLLGLPGLLVWQIEASRALLNGLNRAGERR